MEEFTITVFNIPIGIKWVKSGSFFINTDILFTYMKQKYRDMTPCVTAIGKGMYISSFDAEVVLDKVNQCKDFGDIIFIISQDKFDSRDLRICTPLKKLSVLINKEVNLTFVVSDLPNNWESIVDMIKQKLIKNSIFIQWDELEMADRMHTKYDTKTIEIIMYLVNQEVRACGEATLHLKTLNKKRARSVELQPIKQEEAVGDDSSDISAWVDCDQWDTTNDSIGEEKVE